VIDVGWPFVVGLGLLARRDLRVGAFALKVGIGHRCRARGELARLHRGRSACGARSAAALAGA
jgi:hypothetical protein